MSDADPLVENFDESDGVGMGDIAAMMDVLSILMDTIIPAFSNNKYKIDSIHSLLVLSAPTSL